MINEIDNKTKLELSTEDKIDYEKLLKGIETGNVLVESEDLKIENDAVQTESEMKTLIDYIAKTFPVEEELNGKLKTMFARTMLGILFILTTSICGIIIFQGLGKLYLNEWTLRLFIGSVFIETITLVKIMISSLFPKDDRKIYLNFVERLISSDNSKC